MTTDIHSCSYQCHIPACIKAQRAELLNKLKSQGQREWVRLTDEEINRIAKNYALNNPTTPLHFARAIEAAHGIGA